MAPIASWLGPVDFLAKGGPGRRRGPPVRAPAPQLFDVPPEPPDPPEGSQDGLDLLGFQLAAVGQENQLGRGRVAPPDDLGQPEQRLDRGGNRAQLREEIAPRDFDPPADLLLLSGLQQAAPADVLQVDPNEVELLPRQTRLRLLLGALRRGHPIFIFSFFTFDARTFASGAPMSSPIWWGAWGSNG